MAYNIRKTWNINWKWGTYSFGTHKATYLKLDTFRGAFQVGINNNFFDCLNDLLKQDSLDNKNKFDKIGCKKSANSTVGRAEVQLGNDNTTRQHQIMNVLVQAWLRTS